MNANNQDIKILKNIDRQYGEKAAKVVPKSQKPKHRDNFNKMSVNDILAMGDDYALANADDDIMY